MTPRARLATLVMAMLAGCYDRCCMQDCVRKHREWVKGGCTDVTYVGDVPIFGSHDCYEWKCDEYTACPTIEEEARK
jgi:hypothetical protein